MASPDPAGARAHRLARRYVRWAHAHYALGGLLAIAVTTGAALIAARLPLHTDLATLLPRDYASVRTLDRIVEATGGFGNLLIVIDTTDPAAAKRFMGALGPALEDSPNIEYVDYRVDTRVFRENKLLFVPLEKLTEAKEEIAHTIYCAKQKANPFWDDIFGECEHTGEDNALWKEADAYRKWEQREYLSSPQEDVFVMMVRPAGMGELDIKIGKPFVEEVRGIIDSVGPEKFHPSLVATVGGSIKNRIDDVRTIKQDLASTAVVALVGVMVVLGVYFRQPLAAPFIIAPLIPGLAVTFALTYFVLGSLNLITAFLFIILLGLGVDYGIHTLNRYFEERCQERGIDECMTDALGHTGAANFTSAATTSAAFLALLITDFKGFSEFGFIAGTGVILGLASILLTFPLFVFAAERFGLVLAPKRLPVIPDDHFFQRRAGALLGAGVAVSVLALVVIPRVEFEYDFNKLRFTPRTVQETKIKQQRALQRSTTPAVVLAPNDTEARAIVKAVRAIDKSDTESPTIDAVYGLTDLVPSDQQAKIAVLKDIQEMIDAERVSIFPEKTRRRIEEFRDDLTPPGFTRADLPPEIVRRFIPAGEPDHTLVYIYPSVELADGRNALAFADDVGTITTASGATYNAGSGNIVFADTLRVMMLDSRYAVGGAFVVVLVLLYLHFRKPRDVIIVLTPLLTGLAWMVGAMVFMGMRLSFFNMVVLPSLIGIGIDNGVHMYHRYRVEGAQSMPKVISTTGRAILASTLTTMIGFSGLVLARHGGLRSIGLLAILGLTTCLLGALTIFPAMLIYRDNRARVVARHD